MASTVGGIVVVVKASVIIRHHIAPIAIISALTADAGSRTMGGCHTLIVRSSAVVGVGLQGKTAGRIGLKSVRAGTGILADSVGTGSRAIVWSDTFGLRASAVVGVGCRVDARVIRTHHIGRGARASADTIRTGRARIRLRWADIAFGAAVVDICAKTETGIGGGIVGVAGLTTDRTGAGLAIRVSIGRD